MKVQFYFLKLFSGSYDNEQSRDLSKVTEDISSRAENKTIEYGFQNFLPPAENAMDEKETVSLFQLKSPSCRSLIELLPSELKNTAWEHYYLHEGKFILLSTVTSTKRRKLHD